MPTEDELDKDFDAGFDGTAAGAAAGTGEAAGAGEATGTGEAAGAGEAAGTGEAAGAGEAAGDEVIQLTRSQWDELQAKLGKVDEVRDTVFGRIGGVERALKTIQEATPVGQKLQLTEDIVADMAADFPDVSKHTLAALQKLADLMVGTAPAAPSEAPVDTDAIAMKVRRTVVEETLDETHAGWKDIIGLPDEKGVIPRTEFRDWLEKQPAEYVQRVKNSHSPVTIGGAIDAFHKAKRDDDARREQLAAGLNPRGSGGHGTATKSSDDDAFDAGFNGT